MYLYAIVDRRPPRRELLGRGIGRQPLSLVRAGNAFAVVERHAAPAPTTAALVAHHRVVRRLWRILPAVLPMRFGSTASGSAEVQASFAPLSAPIDRAVDRVRGCVQFTMRVSGLRAPIPSRERRKGPGTRWLVARAAAQMVPELAGLGEATRPFVRSARVERDASVPDRASVYHLVARGDVKMWRAALSRALAALPRTVHVSITGPWPAWSFAELS